MVVRGYLVFHAGEHAQLTLDGHVVLVSVVHYLLGEGYILLKGEVRAVDHHRREAAVDAALAQLEAVAVVEVEYNLGLLPAELLGILDGTLGHIAQQSGVCVVAGTLGYLEYHGRLLLGGSLDDGLQLLHIVEVEGGDSVSALDGLGKHLAGVDQT